MIELLKTRRSIRKYEKRQLDERSIEIMKEAMLYSPSSRGINPWNFIFVDRPDLLKKLSEAKEHGSAFLKDAALGIVVCGDETKSDVWIEDCSIASIIVQLTAHSIGLGSCWIQIRNRHYSEKESAEDYIRKILHIPERYRVLSIISIGYPAERKSPVSRDKLDFSKILYNDTGLS